MSRNKPLSPAAHAERRARERAAEREAAKKPETWGVNEAALSLPANETVELVHDARKRVQTGWRTDVFQRFHRVGRLTLDHMRAVDRLQKQMEARRGEGSRDLGIRERIDGGGEGAAEAFVERRVEAGRGVDMALALCGRTSGKVLRALLEPMDGGQWRNPTAVVRELVGMDGFTSAAIVWACADLVAAYGVIDSRARPTAEQRVAA